jgi:hypothetical protein
MMAFRPLKLRLWTRQNSSDVIRPRSNVKHAVSFFAAPVNRQALGDLLLACLPVALFRARNRSASRPGL